MPAPIALFVYKRAHHTAGTIAALSQCPEARESDLLVFADGPRNESERPAVEASRAVVANAEGFRSVHLTARERNVGLSKNLVSGVEEALSRSDQIIVLEDDIEVTPDFLTFMNAALEYYASRPEVFSISGYLYPVDLDPRFSFDTFLFSRFSCWGWATWRDRWNQIEWKKPGRAEFLRSEEFWQIWRISNDLPEIMLDLIDGKNDSWAILFNLTQIRSNGYSVHPVQSLARNTGFDGTGTHARRLREPTPFAAVGLGSRSSFRFADTYDDGYVEPLRGYFAHRFRRKLKNLVMYGRYF